LGARPLAGAPASAAEQDVGPVSPPAPATGGRRLLGGRFPVDPVVLVAAVLVLVPPLVAAVSALRHPWIPTNDWALMELKVRDVGTSDTPLVGVWSRFGWDHPGPLLFYALALPYRLVPADRGMLFAAACINVVAVGGFAAVVTRFPRIRALVALAGLAVLERGMGVDQLGDPWNPTILVVPFALFAVLCLDIAERDRRWTVPVAAGVACFVVQSHVGLLAPVGMLAVVAGVLRWRRHRRDRALDTPEVGELEAGELEAGEAARVGLLARAWAARRRALPTLAVLFLAWLPPLIDQVNGEGNLGLLFRWARGDDIGGGMGPLTEGHLERERIVESAAWLLHPTGLWAGRFAPIQAFGSPLLGVSSPWVLLWVPVALGLAAAVVVRAPMPAAYRRGAAIAGLLAATGVIAVGADLVTAQGAPVFWPFRWAVAVVLLLMVTLGWAVAGLVVERFPWLDAPLLWRSTAAAAENVGPTGGPTAGRLRLRSALAAGLVVAVALPVGLAVWRGSVGRQPRQEASAAIQRLAPAIERYAGQEKLVVANTVDLMNDKDLAVAVVLDRAGIDWIGIDDPRAVGHHRYLLSPADILDNPMLAMPLMTGQIELLARSGPPQRGEPPDSELVLLRSDVTDVFDAPGAS
jgi:hypothetical protein